MLKLNKGSSDMNSAAMNIEDYNFDMAAGSMQDYGALSQSKRADIRTVVPSRDVSNLRGKTETRVGMMNENAEICSNVGGADDAAFQSNA